MAKRKAAAKPTRLELEGMEGQVWLLGTCWTVRFGQANTAVLTEGEGAVNGYCDRSQYDIMVCTQGCRQKQISVLWHEIKHAMYYLAGKTSAGAIQDMEEVAVTLDEAVEMAFFRDPRNAWVVQLLTEDPNDE